MPKRSTATFTSEDAPASEEAQLFVYYCKYSGEHCLITDAALSALPRRRTDGALVLDTECAVVRLHAQPQPPKYIKRAEGELEKQLRYHTSAGLPFAYRAEPGGRYLYILPDALTSYVRNAGDAAAAVPVPPCIQRLRAGNVQVALALEERAKSVALLRITADEVGVSVTRGAMSCNAELLELFAKALGCRQQQLSLLKGWSDRSKLLLVAGMPAEEVYQSLQAWLDGERARGALKSYAPPAPPAALMPPPPARPPAAAGAGAS